MYPLRPRLYTISIALFVLKLTTSSDPESDDWGLSYGRLKNGASSLGPLGVPSMTRYDSPVCPLRNGLRQSS
ncbi:unnamed protein product [Phytophthora fragariaefolia]|uniref:Unnamed protein product n=1 Tax=Phytophthora fragariaefolia TaxID=1490495 RepID=A0A9W6YHK3_9STRA|nr:unnamed protein product [Phytophthora fragariaefolia]